MEIAGVVSPYQTGQSAGSSEQLNADKEKKAVEIEEHAAKEIIEAIPDSSSSIGQNVDVTV